jgi:hypothetical protein
MRLIYLLDSEALKSRACPTRNPLECENADQHFRSDRDCSSRSRTLWNARTAALDLTDVIAGTIGL